MLRLPFRDESFDVAICANSFHYFRKPAACLTEIRRVLRPAGDLILVDWCDDYLSCKLCGIWLRVFDTAFHRTYSLHACDRLLRKAQFDVVSMERFRISWLWGIMRLVGRRD